MSRRRQSSRSHASSAGSTTGVSPKAAAMASRVRSSGVGPRPPVETTRSARSRPARNASVTTSSRSGRAVIRRTRTPRSVSARASSPAFVSRVSPTVSSLPMLRSSAVRSARRRDGRLPSASVPNRRARAGRPRLGPLLSSRDTPRRTGPPASIRSHSEHRPGRPADPEAADRARRSARPTRSRHARSASRPAARSAAAASGPAAAPAPAPGFRAQIEVVRDAAMRLVMAHVELAKAEVDRDRGPDRPGRWPLRRGRHRPGHRRRLASHHRHVAVPRGVDPRLARLGRPPRHPGVRGHRDDLRPRRRRRPGAAARPRLRDRRARGRSSSASSSA